MEAPPEAQPGLRPRGPQLHPVCAGGRGLHGHHRGGGWGAGRRDWAALERPERGPGCGCGWSLEEAAWERLGGEARVLEALGGGLRRLLGKDRAARAGQEGGGRGAFLG